MRLKHCHCAGARRWVVAEGVFSMLKFPFGEQQDNSFKTSLSRSAAHRRVQLTTLTAPVDTSAGAVARLAPRSSCCSPFRMPMKRDRTRHFRYTVHQPGTAPTHIGIIYRATQTLTGSPRILVFIRGRLPVMLVWLHREPVDCQH